MLPTVTDWSAMGSSIGTAGSGVVIDGGGNERSMLAVPLVSVPLVAAKVKLSEMMLDALGTYVTWVPGRRYGTSVLTMVCEPSMSTPCAGSDSMRKEPTPSSGIVVVPFTDARPGMAMGVVVGVGVGVGVAACTVTVKD